MDVSDLKVMKIEAVDREDERQRAIETDWLLRKPWLTQGCRAERKEGRNKQINFF
jgi:hypothetical protein